LVIRASFSTLHLPSTIIVCAAMIVGAFGISVLPLSVLISAMGVLAVVIGTLIEPGIGLIVTLLVAPWAAWMNVYTPGVLPIDAGQIMIALTLAAWVLRGLAKRELFLPKSPLFVPLAIFVGWAAITLLWAPDLSFGLPEVIKWIEISVIMLFSIDLAQRKGIKWIVVAVLLTMMVQALIGLYEARVRGVGPLGFQLSAGVYRAYGTFEQPNPFGGFIGIGLPIAVALVTYCVLRTAYCVIRRRSLRMPGAQYVLRITHYALMIVYGAIALLLALALYLSFSRGAWLGAAAAIGAMIVFAPRRLWIGFIEFGHAGQCFAALPLVVGPVHGQDVQYLAGFQQVHVVTQDREIPKQDGARLQPELVGDHKDRIARLDGVLGHILARPGGDDGMQDGLARNPVQCHGNFGGQLGGIQPGGGRGGSLAGGEHVRDETSLFVESLHQPDNQDDHQDG
jgi:hypothetical protein